MKKIVVILPTYNEKNNVAKFTEAVLAQESKIPGWRVEVLIVDSASPDGTGLVAKELAKKNPRVHYIDVERGLGVGIIKGHMYSLDHLNPDIMAQMDADGQVEADVLPKMVKAIEDGHNLAIGSRFVEGGKNNLSLSRRIFSAGSSWICRIIMGPYSIKEFTNSARAFTPQLFKKINLDRVPWQEQSFIIQPAFLNEAIVAGAKYKEVPLVFKDRAEGYSKNKTFNYTFDVITYAIDARIRKMGLNIPFFYITRRSKVILKFGVVGFTGTVVDFIFYNIFISYFGFRPATAKGFSTEIAIFNNFLLNDNWTFRNRKTSTNFFQKFGIFNLVSLGGLAISVVIVKLLHEVYGDGVVNLMGVNVAYYNLYFFATIPPVMIWNFTINHFITWRHKKGE